MTISIHSSNELIAAIPHLLRFKPEESIVFVPVRFDFPIARVDFPTTPRDRELVLRSIRDGFCRYAQPGASVGIVCLTADRQTADLVGQELASRLDTIGIETHVRRWADDSQWCDLDSGEFGLQTEAARGRMAAMTVLNGRTQPAPNRESLAKSLIGDREPVAKLMPEARKAASASTPRIEGRWAVGRLAVPRRRR